MKKLDIKTNIGVIANPNNQEIYGKYLSEISKDKPLTKEEEVEVFTQIEKDSKSILNKIWKTYRYILVIISAFSDIKPLTKKELLLEIRKKTNKELKDKIAKHNLAFVISVAKHYSGFIRKSMLTLEDLISEGNMGLYVAIDKYDYKKDYKFISYAIWHIRAYILKCIGDNIKSVRIPLNVQNTLHKLMAEQSKLEQKMGGAVDFHEVVEEAKKTGKLPKDEDILKILKLIGNSKSDKSLSESISHEDDLQFGDTIASEDATPIEYTEKKDTKIKVEQLLSWERITPKLKDYLIDYFGLYGKEPMSFKEMGEKYEENPATIQFRLRKCLRRIRSRHRNNADYFTNSY